MKLHTKTGEKQTILRAPVLGTQACRGLDHGKGGDGSTPHAALVNFLPLQTLFAPLLTHPIFTEGPGPCGHTGRTKSIIRGPRLTSGNFQSTSCFQCYVCS